MLKRVTYIEALYLLLPLFYLFLDIYGIVDQFIRISREYKSELNPYLLITQGIEQSLLKPPISDIAVLPFNEGRCPLGYSPITISSWPGTKAGCYNKNNGTILDKSCAYFFELIAQEQESWVDIPSQAPYNLLYSWSGFWICVRYANFIFVDFNTSSCPQGYKLCSKGLICIQERDDYPVTSIDFQWRDNGWTLLYSRTKDPNQSAIIDIWTSINGLPCLNPIRLPTIENVIPYPLDPRNFYGCDQFGIDQEFTQKIDEQLLLQFYSDNKIVFSDKKLPNYTSYLAGSSIILYSKTKVSLNIQPSCGQIFDFLVNIKENIKNFTFLTGMMTILIAYNIIIVVVGFVMFLYLFLNKENEEKDKYLREQKCLLHAFHFMPYLLCVLYIVQYSEIPENGGDTINNISVNANAIVNNLCFSETGYHDMFSQLHKNILEMTEYFYGPSKTMGIISYISIIIFLTLRGMRGYYRKETEEYENYYLEKRFIPIRTQPETELTGVDLSQFEDPENYQENLNELHSEESSSNYVRYQDDEERT